MTAAVTVYLPGEVHTDRGADLWFVVAPDGAYGSHMRNALDVLRPTSYVEDHYGPLRRVYPAEVTP